MVSYLISSLDVFFASQAPCFPPVFSRQFILPYTVNEVDWCCEPLHSRKRCSCCICPRSCKASRLSSSAICSRQNGPGNCSWGPSIRNKNDPQSRQETNSLPRSRSAYGAEVFRIDDPRRHRNRLLLLWHQPLSTYVADRHGVSSSMRAS